MLETLKQHQVFPNMREWFRYVFAFAVLILFAAAIGLLALWIAANSYPQIPAGEIFAFYLQNSRLVLLNTLPILLLMLSAFFLSSRVWAAILSGAAPALLIACVNLFKLQTRSDPFIVSDIRLLRTAGGVMGQYDIALVPCMHLAIALCMGMIAFAFLLTPRVRLRRNVRWIGFALCIVVCALSYQTLYASNNTYASFPTLRQDLETWSEGQKFISRGCLYPFLHSAPAAFPAAPEGYRAADAEALYESYADANIPQEQKVNVIGIMCEAFADLSDFPRFADNEKIQEIYAPLHELEENAVCGNLLTNIFAGGTVNSEWCVLTGYSIYDDFNQPTESYVRYLSAQGYDTRHQHPGYKFFYDREHVNEYLGFDGSFFAEDGFAELVDPETAPFFSDWVLCDHLLRQYDEHAQDDMPLFSFSVTYQNHGPYNANVVSVPQFIGDAMGLDEGSYNILCNYFFGINDTIQALLHLTNELETREEPVVLFFFGDHKPWLGNDMSIYAELGVNTRTETMEGFANYYATPYVIWANRAAKEVLGREFVGEGGDFSPCFLMTKVFDECGWEGSGFMQLSRRMRAITPLVSLHQFFLKDGQLVQQLEGQDAQMYRSYRGVEYWREHNALRKNAAKSAR